MHTTSVSELLGTAKASRQPSPRSSKSSQSIHSENTKERHISEGRQTSQPGDRPPKLLFGFCLLITAQKSVFHPSHKPRTKQQNKQGTKRKRQRTCIALSTIPNVKCYLSRLLSMIFAPCPGGTSNGSISAGGCTTLSSASTTHSHPNPKT